MKIILYRLSFLLIALIIVTGQLAKAATPCCCSGSTSDSKSEEVTEGISCHSKADTKAENNGSNNKKSNSCIDCDCSTCLKTSFIDITSEYKEIVSSDILFFIKLAFNSDTYSALFEPPKQIS